MMLRPAPHPLSRPPRRLRGLLALVAVVALALTGWRWWMFAHWAGRQVLRHEVLIIMIQRHGVGSMAHTRAVLAYHRALRDKYEAARWRPWHALSPDPDPPVAPPGDDEVAKAERRCAIAEALRSTGRPDLQALADQAD